MSKVSKEEEEKRREEVREIGCKMQDVGSKERRKKRILNKE